MITGSPERTLEFILQELLDAGITFKNVYDIGANEGKWYRKWKHKFPRETMFYLIEAFAGNKLLDDNHSHSIYAVLSDKDDKEVKFYLSDNDREQTTGNSIYQEMTDNYLENHSIDVTTITLDSLIKQNKLPQPDFIKIDTQGSEIDIFNGSKEALKHTKAIITEMPIMWYNKGAPRFDQYIETLYEHDFVPSGVHHVAIRKGIWNQIDAVFVKKDIVQQIHNYQKRYKGF